MKTILEQYITERSVYFRIVLNRINLTKVINILTSIPIEIDQFFLDELEDESADFQDIMNRYVGEIKKESYVSRESEVYLIYEKDSFNLIFISFAGKQLLNFVIKEMEKI